MPNRKLVTNLSLSLASILLTLLCFEIGFRCHAHLQNRGLLSHAVDMLEPPRDGPAHLGHMIRRAERRRIVYELKPGLRVSYQGAVTTTNGQGFRGPEVLSSKRPGTYRIVGIGDSFMFGQGVNDEQPYLAVLAELLARARPERSWEVVNTAVPGYNTAMEVETLEAKGLAYAPDLVVIDFVANDFGLPNFIRCPRPVLALDRSLLRDYFRGRRPRGYFKRLEQAGFMLAPARGTGDSAVAASQVPPEYRDLVGWDAYSTAMGRLRQLARTRGFDVLVISLALADSPAKGRALALSRDLGFHVLDVGSFLRRHLSGEGWGPYLGSPLALSASDGHPSALGHRLAATAIRDYLLSTTGLLAGPDDQALSQKSSSSTPRPSARRLTKA